MRSASGRSCRDVAPQVSLSSLRELLKTVVASVPTYADEAEGSAGLSLLSPGDSKTRIRPSNSDAMPDLQKLFDKYDDGDKILSFAGAPYAEGWETDPLVHCNSSTA